MDRRPSPRWLVLPIAAAAIAAGLWHGPSEPAAGAAPLPSGWAGIANPFADADAAAGEPAPTARSAPRQRAARDAAPASLARAYAAAGDLRAFVAQALARAGEGGAFYALRALSECRSRLPAAEIGEFDAAAPVAHAQLHRRSQVIERSQRRCDAFLDAELDDDAVAHVERQGLAAGDPLMRSYQRWMRAVEGGRYEELESALAEVFARRDPLLLEWVGVTGADYWVGNVAASADVDVRERMLDAWRLLACEMGDDCAGFDAGRSLDCLLAARCEADRRDAILAQGRWQTARQREVLDGQLGRLMEAIRTRNPRLALGLE